jgi:hypothetical protein
LRSDAGETAGSIQAKINYRQSTETNQFISLETSMLNVRVE